MPSAATKPPVSEATAAFGSRVKKARGAASLTQEQLAEAAGLHWSYIGQVERGQTNLTLHNILRIAAGLKVDPGELVRALKAP